MKLLPPLLASLALALVPVTASAGTLYKCTGADGIPNYTGKKIAGSHCAVVSTYTAADARPKGPAPVPRAPAASTTAPRAVNASRVQFTTAAACSTSRGC